MQSAAVPAAIPGPEQKNPEDAKPSIQRLRSEAIALLQQQPFSNDAKQHIATLAAALHKDNERTLIDAERTRLKTLFTRWEDDNANQTYEELLKKKTELYFILMMLAKYWPLNECSITHETPDEKNAIVISTGKQHDIASIYACSTTGKDDHNVPLTSWDFMYIRSEASRRQIVADDNTRRLHYAMEARRIGGVIGGLGGLISSGFLFLPMILSKIGVVTFNTMLVGMALFSSVSVFPIVAGMTCGAGLGLLIYSIYRHYSTPSVIQHPQPDFANKINTLFAKVEENAKVNKPELEKRLTSTAASIQQLQTVAPVADAKSTVSDEKNVSAQAETAQQRRKKHLAAVERRLLPVREQSAPAAEPAPAADRFVTATLSR